MGAKEQDMGVLGTVAKTALGLGIVVVIVLGATKVIDDGRVDATGAP